MTQRGTGSPAPGRDEPGCRCWEVRARIDATIAELTATRVSLDQVIAANRIHGQSLAA